MECATGAGQPPTPAGAVIWLAPPATRAARESRASCACPRNPAHYGAIVYNAMMRGVTILYAEGNLPIATYIMEVGTEVITLI